MTQEEIIAELQSLKRQSEDAFLLNQTVYETFLPLYITQHELLPSKDGHDRAMELYCNVYPYRDQAKRMQKEADFFQATIDLIEELNSLNVTNSMFV